MPGLRPGKYGRGVVDLVLAFLTLMGFAVVLLLAVGAFTVLPFFVTLERAEQRGLDPTVWGWIWAGALVGTGVLGLLLAKLGLGKASLAPGVSLWVVPFLTGQFGREGAKVPGAHR